MDCETCRDQLLAYVYAELPDQEKEKLEAHLQSCTSCRRELEALVKGRELLAGWQPPAASADLFERLENRIELQRQQRHQQEHLALNIQLVVGVAVVIFFVIAVVMSGKRHGTLLASPVQVVKKSFDVTVFNRDLALVKDRRLVLNLKPGENLVRFDDVPALIQPDSVRFRSLTDAEGCRVLEQNFEYGLASAGAVLEKYIDRQLTCVMKDGTLQAGFLKAYESSARRRARRRAARASFQLRQLTLSEEETGGRTYIIDAQQIQAIRFARMPEGLLSKPTLVWKLEAPRGDRHEVEVSYLTNGMDWQAHYRAQVKPGDKIDLEGWVTTNNSSGATFKEAGLKLLAGDVHIVQPPAAHIDWSKPLGSMDGGISGQPQFVEKPLFEYHLYTLTRRTTLNDCQVKQIMFVFPTFDIPCVRRYIYRGAMFEKYRGYDTSHRAFGTECNTKVNVMLEFEDSRENGLGIPLPKGVIRLYSEDAAGESQFIGEDIIDHTPREEKVELYVGNAFDVVGKRRQTDFLTSRREAWESFEISVRNHKGARVKVDVIEDLYRWHNWKITYASHRWEKLDARTIKFPVTVEPEQEAKITYMVHYNW